MRVLVDTNVVLDVLMAREPHLERALALFTSIEAGRVRGVLGATSVTTVFYLAAKAVGANAVDTHDRGGFASATPRTPRPRTHRCRA